MTRTTLAAALLLAAAAASAADWPQWRGPNRDGHSKDTGLLKEWAKDGPPLRWKAPDIGTGYSSPAVAGGTVYLQTTKGNDEFALALDEKTGKEKWTAPIGHVGKNEGPQYPGTRSTPTVDGDRLYCVASDGMLTCLDTAGKPKWQKNLVKDFGGRVGQPAMNWAYSESVLVDGDAVVCTPGGETATVLALNKTTGEVIWKCPVPGGEAADYASLVVAEAGGVRQYVQFLRKSVVGVEARTGKFLWKYEKTASRGANILTPVVSGNKVFTSSGQTGGGMFELKGEGDKQTPTEAYFDKQFGAGIGGAVLVDGHIYATNQQAMFCVEFATGKLKWTERGVGPASLCVADGRIYARGHAGG
ncbi:MAG: PQQ-like beta-propeller repeat protein, partial [Gemmataceae bacterium]|nr:PQQ-like beta-propeller repeat protein [Gemmataceae bacterium]